MIANLFVSLSVIFGSLLAPNLASIALRTLSNSDNASEGHCFEVTIPMTLSAFGIRSGLPMPCRVFSHRGLSETLAHAVQQACVRSFSTFENFIAAAAAQRLAAMLTNTNAILIAFSIPDGVAAIGLNQRKLNRHSYGIPKQIS